MSVLDTSRLCGGRDLVLQESESQCLAQRVLSEAFERKCDSDLKRKDIQSQG